MSDKLLDQEVPKPSIIGVTTINHAARVELGLNCSEYVMMNYVYYCAKNKIPMTVNDTYRKTGMEEHEQIMVCRTLSQKGFMLVTTDIVPVITSKWETAFTNLDSEFEKLFWTRNGKNIWLGSSRKQSLAFYVKARKDYSREVVISGMTDYLEYLEWERKTGFNRAIMGAEKFLNTKNEYFLVDWKQKTDEIKKRLQPEKAHVEPITKETRRKAYE